MQVEGLNSADRGLNYGDGFFTTVLIKNHRPMLWSYHRQRLLNAAQALKFPLIDLDELYAALLLKIENLKDGVAKIVITRGVGGRGYGLPKSVSPNCLISTGALPTSYPNWREQGLHLGIAQQRLASGSSFSAVKTLNRLEQVMMKIEADESQFDDLVCVDIFDHVIECVASNLFWVKGKNIYTSDLKGSGVAGVQRHFLLDNAKGSPFSVKLGSYSISDIINADEVFISNSLLQFAPVRQLNEQVFQQNDTCRWFQHLVNHVS
ncbi:aminodeoxychorismate lyase [Agarivorans sp. MS3-6]